jgi:uncharacterized membrane protein YjdF
MASSAPVIINVGALTSASRSVLLALVAIWSLWRARARPSWFMPAVAVALVVGTLVSLASTPIT